MTNDKLFNLSKDLKDKKNNLNIKFTNNLKKNIHKVIKSFNAYLIHNCDIFKNFTGRDIDAFFKKTKQLKKINNNAIYRDLDEKSLRIHLNDKNSEYFLSLDLEKINTMPKSIGTIFKNKFDNKIYCKHTQLHHLDKKSIIFYKLIKYFYYGTIHSYRQLLFIKNDIKKLSKTEIDIILKSIEKILPNEKKIIKNFIIWDFNKFYKNRKVNKFFFYKRLNRHKKRRIFFGKLNFKKLIFSKKFIYALLLGSFAKWKSSHNSMPAISIVGNDGSGKTTVTNYIKKNFSKMDPLIFDMKASVPYFYFILKIRNKLKKIRKLKIIKNISFLRIAVAFIGEFLDLFDKYVKFRIGMAWADGGYGLTVFERFPTDRIRGEFPNKKNKLIPFEQFFPFPDGIIYLDVLPKDSITRKKNDNHTLDEMRSKRKNYLSLLKEFDEVKILSSHMKLNRKILNIKNYIFKIYKKKNSNLKKNGKMKRMKWKKNFRRVLAGGQLNKTQKDAFFE